MIYIIIPLLFVTFVLAGIMFYVLERNKIEKQPSYVQTESNDEILKRLS